jgi:hypothetical protein
MPSRGGHRPAGGQRGVHGRQLQRERWLFLPVRRPATGGCTAPHRPAGRRECGTRLGRERPWLGAANERDGPEPRRLGGCGGCPHRERGRAVPQLRARRWPRVLPPAEAVGRGCAAEVGSGRECRISVHRRLVVDHGFHGRLDSMRMNRDGAALVPVVSRALSSVVVLLRIVAGVQIFRSPDTLIVVVISGGRIGLRGTRSVR